MRCRDAKFWLDAQQDGDLELSVAAALQEHLQHCAPCRALAQRQPVQVSPVQTAAPLVRASISTDQIMRAVQQQRHITQQLEHLQQQQRTRIEQMRAAGTAAIALGIFALSCVPLVFLALTIIQTDLMMKALALLNGAIDLVVVLAQYMQAGLTLLTRNAWLLSGVAFVLVVMMGMWLRLMRSPHEA